MLKKDNFKQNLKAFFQKYKHAWVLLYVFIYFPWFTYLEKHVTSNFNVIHTALDDKIPFIEFFIVPYMLWFGYVAYAVLYFFFKNKEDYYRLCTFLFVGMTVFLVVSSLYPNGHYLRPHSFEHDNVFTHMVAWLYATDTPTNLFPSIHVYNSVMMCVSLLKSHKIKQHTWLCFLIIALAILICMSTVMIKQHAFMDIVWALVLAIVIYSIGKWKFDY